MLASRGQTMPGMFFLYEASIAGHVTVDLRGLNWLFLLQTHVGSLKLSRAGRTLPLCINRAHCFTCRIRACQSKLQLGVRGKLTIY